MLNLEAVKQSNSVAFEIDDRSTILLESTVPHCWTQRRLQTLRFRMPPPYFLHWGNLYAALESGPNFPTNLRIHVPDTIFFNDHKFPQAWYASSNYRLRKHYKDHLSIPRVCEDLKLKSNLSSTFALHFESYTEFISKREFILRAKGWLHAETRHPSEIPWVLQMYNIPATRQMCYFTSYLQPGKLPFSIVNNIVSVPAAERKKQQMQKLKFDNVDPLKKHSFEVEIGGANLSIRDPFFLRMKRLTLHLVTQVEKCKNMTILGNVDIRCLICEFLPGQDTTVQLINVLGYHMKSRQPTWMVDIDSDEYENRIESFVAKKINRQLYTEAQTPKTTYHRGAPKVGHEPRQRQGVLSENTEPEEPESKETNDKISMLTDPEVLRREEALNAVFYKLYKDMRKKLQRPIDVFKRIDLDENGTISPQELRTGLLKDMGFVFTDEEFQNVINIVDADGSGEIEYDELTQRIKNSDPKRRERMKRRAMRRYKRESQGLGSQTRGGWREKEGKKLTRFSAMVDAQNKGLKASDIRAAKEAAGEIILKEYQTERRARFADNPRAASTVHKQKANSASDKRGKQLKQKKNLPNVSLRKELEEKTALLEGAQKMVDDLSSALKYSLLSSNSGGIDEKAGATANERIPGPPAEKMGNKGATPLSARVNPGSGLHQGEQALLKQNQILEKKIIQLKQKLNEERGKSLESLRCNQEATRKLNEENEALKEELSSTQSLVVQLEENILGIQNELQDTKTGLAEIRTVMIRRTSAHFRQPVANLAADEDLDIEESRKKFRMESIQYVITQNEPMLRWIFLTYAAKETGTEYRLTLDDAKRLTFDAGIVNIDAPKLSQLFRRSNTNSISAREDGISFLQYIEFIVRMSDELFRKKEKSLCDRLVKLMEEHIIPFANLIIGDAAEDM